MVELEGSRAQSTFKSRKLLVMVEPMWWAGVVVAFALGQERYWEIAEREGLSLLAVHYCHLQPDDIIKTHLLFFLCNHLVLLKTRCCG